jgi:RHS repeat-associated protein
VLREIGKLRFKSTDTSKGYQVTKATSLGVTNTYQTTFSSVAKTSTGQQFTSILPCGVKATSSETQANNQLSESESLPSGSSYSTIMVPDPRWGIQVPVSTSTTLNLGNLTEKESHKRTASLGTAGNPFTLITQTDTDSINGRVYTSIFTASNRTYTNTSPFGRQQLVTLDAKERIASTQESGLLPIQFAYDSRGRLASATQGIRNTTLTYDADGRVASIIDPLKLKRSFTYDPDGRVLTLTLPDGRIINQSYDANGNLTVVTPPGKPAHDFSFNSINMPSVYTPPTVAGTGHTTYVYDADRRLSLITRPDGGKIKYSYDHAGRLSSLVTPTETTNYGYSATTCNLISAGVPGGEQLTYGYNGPLLTTTSWTGTLAGNVSRVYNDNYWIASESIGGGNTVAFTYDNDGLLEKAGTLTLSHAPTNGLLNGTTLGAASDALTYNAFGELMVYTASSNATAVYHVVFTRDNLGRIATKSETIGGKTTNYTYNYEASGRLSSVLQNGVTAISYTYDSNSNRLTATTGALTTKGTYDAQDRLLSYGSASYTYSANGELASKSVGALKTTYQYDALGNLLTVTLATGKKISYVIDPQNRRIGKKVNGAMASGFLYDDDRLVAQLSGSNAVVSQFIYASRDNVPDYMLSGGVTYRIFSDQLGSPRLVMNASSGQIAERIDYDVFGNVIFDTNPGFQPFGFAGGLYDQDTKLVRFGARDYDPGAGRWTAKDPLLFGGGDINLYGYVLNDPVNLSDPSGLDNVPDIFGESLPNKAQRAQPPKKGVQEYKEVEKEAEKTSQSALDYFKSLVKLFKEALCGVAPPPPPQQAPPKLPEFQRKPAP